MLYKLALSVHLGSASAFFSSRFLLFFFFIWPAFVDFGRQYLLLWTVYTLFTHCAYTVYILKNIKNGSHDTIYTFKIYFVTVFSINTPLLNPRPTYQPTKQVRPTRWGKEPHPLTSSTFSSLDVRRVQTPNPSCMSTRE